jgi:tetratricopeptide (TPR) repeat protein
MRTTIQQEDFYHRDYHQRGLPRACAKPPHDLPGGAPWGLRWRAILWLVALVFCTGSNLVAQSAGTGQAAYDQALAAAQSALEREDFDAALSQATEALKARPDDPAAKSLQSKALEGKKQTNNRSVALRLSQEAIKAGDYDQAIELLNLVVEGWPADATAKELLARAQEGKRSTSTYEKAVAEAARALNSGENDAAIAYAGQALKFRPGDRTALDILTRAQIRKEAEKPGTLQGVAAVPPTEAKPIPAAEAAVPPATKEGVTTPEAAATPGPAPDLGSTKRKTANHEVSVSGDYFLGQGNVTMPFGFALAQVPGVGANLTPTVAKPDRSSSYLGATLSYGYKRAWYLDLQYAHGSSSGNADVDLGPPSALPSQFSIDDNVYQVYVRYTFPGLRFTPLSAYLRVGGSFVQATLQDSTVIPALGLYHQTDDTQDYLGNFGGGVGYAVYTGQRIRLGVQVEAEGFFGTRTQDSQEQLPQAGFSFPSASINNNLYGGIGRATVRGQYGLGKSGLFKVYVEGGMQGKFTSIKYSSEGNFTGGSYSELLWGPYAKVGVRYSF